MKSTPGNSRTSNPSPTRSSGSERAGTIRIPDLDALLDESGLCRKRRGQPPEVIETILHYKRAKVPAHEIVKALRARGYTTVTHHVVDNVWKRKRGEGD